MIFVYRNEIEDYTITADSYNDTFTAENLKTRSLTKIWKGPNSGTDQRIIIDAGASVAPQIIAILGHNFTTETISIQANSSDSWGSPAIDYEFASIKDIMFYLYTGTAYRYWSILIENCNIPDTPPQIGHIKIGSLLDFSDPAALNSPGIDDNSVFQKSEGNELFGYKGQILARKFELDFQQLTESEVEDFIDMFTEVGKAYQLLVIWNATADYIVVPNLYCSFVTGISFSLIGYQISGITISIEECK